MFNNWISTMLSNRVKVSDSLKLTLYRFSAFTFQLFHGGNYFYIISFTLLVSHPYRAGCRKGNLTETAESTTAKALRGNQEIWLFIRKIHYLDHLLSDAQLSSGERYCILCTQTGRRNKYRENWLNWKVETAIQKHWNSHPKRVAWRSLLPRNCEGKKKWKQSSLKAK